MNELTGLLPYIKLRMNIEYPADEESYSFGYECALAKVSEEENPYPEGSNAYQLWLEGWWDGFYGEEPLFTKSSSEKKLVTKKQRLAANDHHYHHPHNGFITTVLKITDALTATAAMGYHFLDNCIGAHHSPNKNSR